MGKTRKQPKRVQCGEISFTFKAGVRDDKKKAFVSGAVRDGIYILKTTDVVKALSTQGNCSVKDIVFCVKNTITNVWITLEFKEFKSILINPEILDNIDVLLKNLKFISREKLDTDNYWASIKFDCDLMLSNILDENRIFIFPYGSVNSKYYIETLKVIYLVLKCYTQSALPKVVTRDIMNAWCTFDDIRIRVVDNITESHLSGSVTVKKVVKNEPYKGTYTYMINSDHVSCLNGYSFNRGLSLSQVNRVRVKDPVQVGTLICTYADDKVDNVYLVQKASFKKDVAYLVRETSKRGYSVDLDLGASTNCEPTEEVITEETLKLYIPESLVLDNPICTDWLSLAGLIQDTIAGLKIKTCYFTVI